MSTSFATVPGVVPLSGGRTGAGGARWDLIRFLVGARLRLWTQDRVLGFWWWLLEPMAMTATYFLMVKVFFKHDQENYPLFIMCAMLPWVWFTTAGAVASRALVQNARLIKSFRVSYVVFPTAEVLATTIRFVASLAILVILMAYFRVVPTWHLLGIPVLIAVQLVFTLGTAYWLAVSQVYIEDTINVWQVVTRIWFFLSPSIYSLDHVPEHLRSWYLLNPFAPLFHSYRLIVMQGEPPSWRYLAFAAGLGGMLMISGGMMMRRLQGALPLHL